MSTPLRIAPGDRIPLGQKIAFAAGVNTDYVATGLLISHLWMPFFNIGLGISPVVLGGILMLLRAWDAITDPIMGNISDNARTRWGRRRPFMFVGAIATALAYPGLWNLPDTLGETARAVCLAGFGLFFFTCFTLWSMPYYALQLELTPNYDERTRLTAWMTLFGKVSSFIGGWLLAFVLFVGMLALDDPKAIEGKPEFLHGFLSWIQPWLAAVSGTDGSEKPIVAGMRITGWLLAIGILAMGLMPALFVKERYYKAEASKQPREPFWRSVKESLRCSPLWVLITLSFFLVLGTSSVASLGHYVNFYYVCGGDLVLGSTIIGLKSSIVVVTGISLIPFYTWLGEKLDKRTVVMVMLSVTMFGHLLNWFLMTPQHPYWQIIPGVFEASALSAVWLFLPSMKADVADYDELGTSRRREGALNAFYSWFIKASLTAAMGLGGFVLHISGFDPKLDVQLDPVTQRMFMIYLVLPVAIWSVALIATWFYPLTRQRCAEIRAGLESKRGQI
jgi:glycoside/pentoside/hexuronide:cation symporter, GPH family